MNASEWYKPLLNPNQKEEDDLTVSDVFFGMDKNKQDVIKSLMNHAIKRQIFSTQGGEIISGVLHDMTDTELKVTHYLVGKSLLIGEDIFDRIECWLILRSVDK